MVNQAQELNSVVDIGFHYVATSGAGVPIDSDHDGDPDYLEDPNGNGVNDPGETPWTVAVNTQPVNFTVTYGGNAPFSITAVGPSLTYQWRRNGVNIPGATSSSYIEVKPPVSF